MTLLEELILSLFRAIIDQVGKDRASDLLDQAAIDAANAEADAIEDARFPK